MNATALRRVFIVGLGTLVVPLDSSVNVGFPEIVAAFALAVPDIQWVVIAYVLTQTSLLLVFGRVADMLGYRRVFLFGCVWSTVAFVLCGMAEGYPMLLFARVMQGVGAGLMLSCGPALVTSLFPEASRARVLGLYTMIFGIGAALGLLIAGVLVGPFGWSAVFWYRAPISALAFVLVWVFVPATPILPREAQRFDALGALLLVGAIAATLFSFNRLPHAGLAPWVFALCAVAGFVGFVAQQKRVAQPIIQIAHFHNLDFCLINGAHVLVQLAGFSINLLGPFLLAQFTDLSVPMTGVVLASSAVGIIVAAPMTGRLAGRLSPERLVLIGMGCVALGQAGVAFGAALVPIGAIALAFMVQGIGVGVFQTAYLDVVTATLPRAERGVAGALGMLTRTFGTVSGATLLFLAFSSVRDWAVAHGVAGQEAFLAGLRFGFGCAAAIPTVLILVILARGGRWLR
ncbi:MAG: MFS transporter [Acetobacteraceae bacterium]|nr:MFS transporter [Acetobacteraceae bacterium]